MRRLCLGTKRKSGRGNDICSISNFLFNFFFQKPLIELIIGGVQIVARAFTRAVQEEFKASQQAAQRAGGGRQGARRVANDSITGMTLQV